MKSLLRAADRAAVVLLEPASDALDVEHIEAL
jgi:hypothetical protein